ncbi:MAG: GNAT family N-acetyltransferase [Clostridia bacterium]|jgi:ribosomal protein S18 acetylase RimI-like enzyme|nr:GNAT family N-acetyltransferase [Clostridia bacterium]
MKIFRCFINDIAYALEAICVVKHEEDGNPIEFVTEESMRNFLSEPNNYLIVALIDKIVVGYIVAYELQRVDRNMKFMFFYEIGVLTKYRNQGIGSSLINFLKEICKEKKIIKMWVGTNRSNLSAMRLYSKTGGKEDSNGDEVSFTYYPPFD